MDPATVETPRQVVKYNDECDQDNCEYSKIPCFECDFTACSYPLGKHIMIHHNYTFEETKQFLCLSKKEKVHMLNNSDPNCHACRRRFKNVRALIRHNKAKHPDSEMSAADALYDDESARAVHIKCNHCNSNFPDLVDLVTHYREHHISLREKHLYLCKRETMMARDLFENWKANSTHYLDNLVLRTKRFEDGKFIRRYQCKYHHYLNNFCTAFLKTEEDYTADRFRVQYVFGHSHIRNQPRATFVMKDKTGGQPDPSTIPYVHVD